MPWSGTFKTFDGFGRLGSPRGLTEHGGLEADEAALAAAVEERRWWRRAGKSGYGRWMRLCRSRRRSMQLYDSALRIS